ncbi:acyl-CoA dehydrogenase family protein [Mycobacterium sp. NAZ190054]|uniref:acyl-CoA dehydrogenase family protein n=1 Tax=Mycobacterium sp. NAZ190054 TaxID=1747766 RepID=UPI0035106088
MITDLLPRPVGESGVMTDLRAQVRTFLGSLPDALRSELGGIDGWLTRWNPELSRALAQQGWIGMTIPREYGGHGRSFLERFVVTEELLAAGAPVGAHWAADRQVAPSILRFGNEQLKKSYLPRIAAGECFFGIGLSEPDSGSDLASIRTKATRDTGGWRLTGTKLWTSGAHLAHAFVVFARTSPLDAAHRHAGFSQFVVPLDDPGLEVRPVISATGSHHFNEVVLTDVFVPDDHVLGDIGDGWTQVTAELAFERSGPERFLSTYPMLTAALADPALTGVLDRASVGRHVGRLGGLQEMSRSVAGALQRGERADLPASLVKLLGTTFEGDLVEWIHLALADAEAPLTETADRVRRGVGHRPAFTIRGGTNEILRGVIARGLGMR